MSFESVGFFEETVELEDVPSSSVSTMSDPDEDKKKKEEEEKKKKEEEEKKKKEEDEKKKRKQDEEDNSYMPAVPRMGGSRAASTTLPGLEAHPT